MGNLEDILSIILVFGAIPATIILITFRRSKMRHRERLAMIEKGLDISNLAAEDNPLNRILGWGSLLAGFGFGLLIGYLLSLLFALDKSLIIPIMAILFSGIGLLVYYAIKKRS